MYAIQHWNSQKIPIFEKECDVYSNQVQERIDRSLNPFTFGCLLLTELHNDGLFMEPRIYQVCCLLVYELFSFKQMCSIPEEPDPLFSNGYNNTTTKILVQNTEMHEIPSFDTIYHTRIHKGYCKAMHRYPIFKDKCLFHWNEGNFVIVICLYVCLLIQSFKLRSKANDWARACLNLDSMSYICEIARTFDME